MLSTGFEERLKSSGKIDESHANERARVGAPEFIEPAGGEIDHDDIRFRAPDMSYDLCGHRTGKIPIADSGETQLGAAGGKAVTQVIDDGRACAQQEDRGPGCFALGQQSRKRSAFIRSAAASRSGQSCQIAKQGRPPSRIPNLRNADLGRRWFLAFHQAAGSERRVRSIQLLKILMEIYQPSIEPA